jgi:sporulation protein YlmC with PRC-barrel domain
MLDKAKTLTGYSLQTPDGETIGNIKEFHFDDRHWSIRYLVVDTGNWLTGRQVLISPYALVAVNPDHQNIVAHLTKKQIEASPTVATDKPVSRQREEELHSYYGWSPYWSMGPYAGVGYPVPSSLSEMGGAGTGAAAKPTGDPTLRSMQQVRGYHIQGMDGEIGHVEDFVIDDETWAIRYLIVDTRNWWPGKKVLVSPQWIERVSWSESKVFVNLSRDAIKESPEYTAESLISRDYEAGLYGHYQRPGYWDDEPVVQEHSH